MKKRGLRLFGTPLFLLVSIGLSATLFGGGAEKDPVRIGLIAMITGQYADNGESMINAGRLAVSQINDRGGVELGRRRRKVLILVEDDRGIPDGALLSARTLIYRDGVSALIGPQFSSNAIPVSLLAEQAGVVMICPMSTHPDTTAGKRFVFRIPYLDTFQGRALARFAREHLYAERAAVLYDVANAYSRTLAEVFIDSFERDGGRMTCVRTYTTDRNEDFSSQLESIAASRPDLFFLPNYAADVLIQARQARRSGVACTLLGGDGWDGPAFAKEDVFENSYMTRHWHPDLETEAAAEFVLAYRRAYDQVPDDVAATTYDAFSLLFAAIERAGRAEGEFLREGIMALPPFEGVTGTIDYTTTGDPLKSAIITRMKRGEVAVIDIIESLN